MPQSIPIPHLYHDEAGQLTQAIDFDFDSIDQLLKSGSEEELTAEDIDRSLKLFRTLLAWVWQNGMKNTDGLTIRSIIVCWIFLEHLRPMNLTQVANGFGKHKQSLGRWVDDFKIAFPNIRTIHMRETT